MRRAAATAAAALLLVGTAPAWAGGYLVFDTAGAPVGWDPAAPLRYTTDRGALGSLAQAQAEALVVSLFAPWESVPTASLTYQRIGSLAADVTGANFGPYLGPFGGATAPLGKTAVVFDADGEIFEELFGRFTGVVGFAAATWASAGGAPIPTAGPVPPGAKIVEGLVFLNGEFLDGVQEPDNPEIPRPQFEAAIIHELGHLSGLGHTQVHGLQLPPETDSGAWTAPVETMFPFIHPLGGQGSPERDDVVALSRLYPTGGFAAATGCIEGHVLTADGAPFTGANVTAWNLDDPEDALSWVSGAALAGDAGEYALCGLRPGARYRVEVQEIDTAFIGGSRVGPFQVPAILPGPPEAWSGAGESSDPALDPRASFQPLQVAAGETRGGVDLRLNRQGFTVLNPAWGHGPTPVDFAVGDFDEDGAQDLIAVQFGFVPGNLVTFSRGRGDGSFAPPVDIDAFPGNASVVAGQFNAAFDAHLDIAAASDSTGAVRIYFGDGHGGFGPPQMLVPGQGINGISSRLAVGDLNGDAFADLACFTRRDDASATVHALLGSGGGTFTVVTSQIPSPVPDPQGLVLSEIALGQFLGSAANDLLTVGVTGDFLGEIPTLQLLRGDGAGHFTGSTLRLDAVSKRIGTHFAAGDFDEDGVLDLVISDLYPQGGPPNFSRSWIDLLRGDGNGGFGLASRYRVDEVWQPALLAADFDRDGHLDVGSAGSFYAFGTPGAKAHLGLGDGHGGTREVITTWGLAEYPASNPGELAAGDFDGDGKLDVLTGDASFITNPPFVPRLSILLQRDLRGGGAGPCIPGEERLCLGPGGRFGVEATWTTATGSGAGHAVPLTADTGYLWFFGPANVEVVIKVLDACAFNQTFWVFAGGLTDVAVELRVTDSQTGTLRTYRNPQGAPFQPIQDTAAFVTCP